MKYFAALLILVVSGSCNGSGIKNFKNFISNAIFNFPQWIQKHKLDPIMHSVSLDYTPGLLNLTGEISNQLLKNYSHSLNSSWIHTRPLNASIMIGAYGSYRAIGNYMLDGSAFSYIPVHGTGPSELIVPQYVQYEIHNLTYTPDGFLDISRSNINVHVDVATPYMEKFEGLKAGDYENEVIEIVMETIRPQIQSTMTREMRKMFIEYMTEIFASTPINMILTTGW